LVESILDNLWQKLANGKKICWINVVKYIEENKISAEILRLRLGDNNEDPFLGPILLFGFQSLESLIRKETMSPRLLVSPGVYYLRLPTKMEEVKRVFGLLVAFQITGEELLNKIRDNAAVGQQLSNVESALAHGKGNFLGPEKLLYGAHLAGKIDGNTFKNVFMSIRNKQETALRNLPEYWIYRLEQRTYIPDDVVPACGREIEGCILYIDDHAHLGWAEAVAFALWGPCSIKKHDHYSGYNIDYYEDGSGVQRMAVLNKGDVSGGEESFFLAALSCIQETIVKGFDLILLDLRLRWKEDEAIESQRISEISGIRVLKKVRDLNAAIPVLMLTASRKAKNMEKVLEMGADGYVTKEITQAGEEYSEIRDYYEWFRSAVDAAIKKSYLAAAWRVVEFLEKHLRNSRVGKLWESHGIEINDDVILPVKKAIGLLKKKGNHFEERSFNLSFIKESIINLAIPFDTVIQRRLGSKATEKLLAKPLLDSGNLLMGLRAIASHGIGGEGLDEVDAKIALYLCFRLFIGEQQEAIMKEFAMKTFQKVAIDLERVIQRSHTEIEKRVRWEIDNNATAEIDKRLRSVQKTYDELSRIGFQVPAIGRPTYAMYDTGRGWIHSILKHKRINHYLLFLRRLDGNRLLDIDCLLVAEVSKLCNIPFS